MAWFAKKNDNKVNRPPVKPAVVKPAATEASTNEAGSIAVKPSGVKYPFSSEKAVRLQAQGQYTFVVSAEVTKVQLKKEIEKIYGVKVNKITVVNLPGKVVYSRGRAGRRVARRYMRVQLARGQSIDLTKF